MRIGIDVDGVLADMGTYQLDHGSKFMMEKYGIGISNAFGYEIEDIFATSSQKDEEFWKEYIYDYGVKYKARPYAKEMIDKLKKDGHEIIIMTARGGLKEYCTLEHMEMQNLVKTWLESNEIYYDELVFTDEDKAIFCKNLKIDVMVEDKPANVTNIAKIIPVICYDALYNQHIKEKNIYRAYSWYDVYTKITYLSK